jgi:hypothetical protein
MILLKSGQFGPNSVHLTDKLAKIRYNSWPSICKGCLLLTGPLKDLKIRIVLIFKIDKNQSINRRNPESYIDWFLKSNQISFMETVKSRLV